MVGRDGWNIKRALNGPRGHRIFSADQLNWTDRSVMGPVEIEKPCSSAEEQGFSNNRFSETK